MARQQIVDSATADAEFDRFCEEMDLVFDVKGMDADDLKGFTDLKRKVTDAIQSGSLIIDSNGEPVFTPVNSEPKTPIRFHEPRGANFMSMDMKKKNHDVAKGITVIAGQTGENEARFANMTGRDFKVCQAVSALFLL